MDRHYHNAHRAGLAAPERARVDHPGLAALGAAGAGPAGLSPPQIDAPRVGGDGEGRGRKQGSRDGLTVADHYVVGQVETDNKVYSTLRARLALKGCALSRTDAGDAVALAGTLKAGAWIDRDGNARPSLDLVAAQVLTVYALAKKRKASTEASNAQHLPGQPTTTGNNGAADSGPDDPWLRGAA